MACPPVSPRTERPHYLLRRLPAGGATPTRFLGVFPAGSRWGGSSLAGVPGGSGGLLHPPRGLERRGPRFVPPAAALPHGERAAAAPPQRGGTQREQPAMAARGEGEGKAAEEPVRRRRARASRRAPTSPRSCQRRALEHCRSPAPSVTYRERRGRWAARESERVQAAGGSATAKSAEALRRRRAKAGPEIRGGGLEQAQHCGGGGAAKDFGGVGGGVREACWAME